MTTASVRLRLRYDSIEAFVDAFSLFVARAGMFMPTTQPRPVGAEVKFELRLANELPVLVGVGTVLWHREAGVQLPGGMGVQFSRMTRESRDLVMRLLEARAAKGHLEGPDGLPLLPDEATPAPAADAPAQADATGDSAWGEFAALAAHIDVDQAAARARELRGALTEADLEHL